MKNVEVFDGLPKSVVPRMSHHHGEALNLLIKRAGTDFVLVLDPDFYIFNANWIRHSIDFMKREDLSFFGSTWHSVLHNWKWYDFPNCHFLMMNMKKLESESLDFRPGFLDPGFTDPVTRSRDTGYRLRHRFKYDPHHRNAIVEGSDTPNWIREIFLDCEIEDTKIARMEYYKKDNLIDAVHLRRTQSLVQIFDQYSNVRRALVRISEEFSSNSL
ncbi:MAG: hypothetical protein P8N43_11640 [Alphaproteobacteria bacterium]|nr:hypothetical protein [Alphaproteobacteria bacterium]